MPLRLGDFDGEAQERQTDDGIAAFCRHLGELCDLLNAPYDADALTKLARAGELQGTNVNLLLHNAFYHWLGERVELSIAESSGESPEALAARAREAALAQVQSGDYFSQFVTAVAAHAAQNVTGPQGPVLPTKQSLFDLPGHFELLGPDEVDGLLHDLASSDCPVGALEKLVADPHLLEDLCFGPTWPQLCDSLGRLVCLLPPSGGGAQQAAASAVAPAAQQQQGYGQARSTGGWSGGAVGTVPEMPKQQKLLLQALHEVVSAVASSSPPHAAELLDGLAPYLTALALRLPLPLPATVVTAGAAPEQAAGAAAAGAAAVAAGAAGGLLAAVTLRDPFAVEIVRLAQQLVVGLSQEFHTLPHSCAALAARAVCDVVRAGLARGAPAPPPAGAATAVMGGGGSGLTVPGAVLLASVDLDLELSALDLLVLLDPELRWWQRLCSSTHATQRMADAAAATQLAAALEAALAAWAYATAAAAAAAGYHSEGGLAAAMATAGVRSPSHLVACAALLGGLVRANNPALLSCEQPAGSRRVVGALPAVVAIPAPAPAPLPANGTGAGGLSCSGIEGLLSSALGSSLPQAPGMAAAAAGLVSSQAGLPPLPEYSEVPQYTPAQVAEQRQRLVRLLGALCGAACALADRPGLLRPGGAGAEGSGRAGGRGSVFVGLAAGVLVAAAELGVLTWHQPAAGASAGGGSSSGGGGGGALAGLLQAMMRAAAVTAAAAAAAVTGNWAGAGSSIRVAAAAEADAWLDAAAGVLMAVAEHAELAAASTGAALPGPALAVVDALSGLLRHIAGRVRGCTGGGAAAGTDSAAVHAAAATAAPAWSRAVVRLAVAAAPQSPLVAAALTDLAEPLSSLLTARSARRTASAAKAASATAAGKVAPPAHAAVAPVASDAGNAAAGLAASLSLLDILSGGSSSKSIAAASLSATATAEDAAAAPPPPPLQAVELDAVEELGAQLVLAYCRPAAAAAVQSVSNTSTSSASTSVGIAGTTAFPQHLQRPALLSCAARSLCRCYDNAGMVVAEEQEGAAGAQAEAEVPEVPAAEAHPGGGLLSIRGGSGAACAATAAKRQAVSAAAGLARCCPAGQRALLAEGFARRLLRDVSATLHEGEYTSPLCEPLAYADPLAGLGGALAELMAWPGLLSVLQPVAQAQQPETAVASSPAGAAGASGSAAQQRLAAETAERARAEVLLLLQELVTWLDPCCDDSRGVAPQDAAAVSLAAFTALVESDTGAAATLDADTNLRWYLCNLTGEGAAASGAGAAAAGGAAPTPASGGGGGPPQSDMLMDMARRVLATLPGAPPAQ
ncbi:hypothetical protein HYH02_011966 [Chlamydomonas schloesseri]|uniref:Uncharacterized protein n=1 Tax=Chlamydomonas schloesseri TaxID=2026947 RepID=A0A835T190_9CHLO|nr:hypothetical protein HYH02_011966 [Chlamydomonas schloesseri]|eukprot:KAG2435466.1 hypothetical protein HYH02_011966 [Chlamydomonas schloesseri]